MSGAKPKRPTKKPTIWTSATPELQKSVEHKFEEREKARARFLNEHPDTQHRLYGGDDDGFDSLALAAREERERMENALAIVEWLRILPIEQAALKLLGMLDALGSPNEKPRTAGRHKRSIWEDIDEEIGHTERKHNSPAAAERARQRRRKALGLERPPKARQK